MVRKVIVGGQILTLLILVILIAQVASLSRYIESRDVARVEIAARDRTRVDFLESRVIVLEKHVERLKAENTIRKEMNDVRTVQSGTERD